MDVVALGSIAGLVGGCARSLFMFVREIGGHGEFGPPFDRSRWFLYLVKPTLGLVSGPLLLLALTKALIPGFTAGATNPGFNLPLSLVVATTGGIFFEEAFAFVNRSGPVHGQEAGSEWLSGYGP